MEYRYVLKNKNTNQIHFKWYTLTQIESEGLWRLLDIENYDIVNRDRFTGLFDENEKKIFERDTCEGMIVTYSGDQESGLGMNAGWYLQKGDFESWTPLESRCNENGDNYIVTGNVHKNK